MKRRIGLAIVLTICAVFSGHKSGATIDQGPDPIVYLYADKLSRYFESRGCTEGVPCGNRKWVLQFTAEIHKWLTFYRIEHTAEKFLANVAAESWFDPKAISSKGCYGATQVCSERAARKQLKRRGVVVGPLTDWRSQAALGVTIYWMKLKYVTDGEPWDAVQFYCGTGKDAVAHRNKVWRYHRDIFG